MTLRVCSRLRVSLADVTGRRCRQLGSFVVEVAHLPPEFIRWLKGMAKIEQGLHVAGQTAPPAARRRAAQGGDPEQLVRSRPARQKGGSNGDQTS